LETVGHRGLRFHNSMEDSDSTESSIKLHSSETPNMMQPSGVSEVSELGCPSPSPVYMTLQTTELCEQILGNLPLLDLWRTRSACKTFQTVIDHSPSLLENLRSFVDPRARAQTPTYQAYLDQHEIHPLFESFFVRETSRPYTSSPRRFLDQEKPKIMGLFKKEDKFDDKPPTFMFSSATGTGFADGSPLLDMYLCNPEAVQTATRATFWDPITLIEHCTDFRDFAVIKLRGVTIGDIFEKAMSKAVPRQHGGTVINYLWEMEVRVNRLWGAVGPDLGSHVESAENVSPLGELMWNCCALAGCYLELD
jgi:hypothetical protein